MNKYSISKLPLDVSSIIAGNHKKLRKLQGFSQKELAERSGVSFGSIQRFEQTGQISLESLLKLVFILGRLPEFESILTPKEDLKAIDSLFSNKTKS